MTRADLTNNTRERFFNIYLVPGFFLVAFLIANGNSFFTDYYPDSDRAANFLKVEHAKSFSEYLGPYSRFKFQHPGPTSMYALAFLERGLFFLSKGQRLIAPFILNAIFLLFCARLLYDSMPFRYCVLLFLISFLFATRLLTPFLWLDNWAPRQNVLPMMLFYLSCVSFSNGQLRFIFPVTISGIFAFHNHLGIAVILGPVFLAALILFFISKRNGIPKLGKLDWMGMWLALMSLVLLNVPPVYEQFAYDDGNIGKIFQFVKTSAPEYTLGQTSSYIARFFWEPINFIPLNKILLVLLLIAGVLSHIRYKYVIENHFVLLLIVAVAAGIFGARNVRGSLFPYLFWFMFSIVAMAYFLFFAAIQKTVQFKIKKRNGSNRKCVFGGCAALSFSRQSFYVLHCGIARQFQKMRR